MQRNWKVTITLPDGKQKETRISAESQTEAYDAAERAWDRKNGAGGFAKLTVGVLEMTFEAVELGLGHKLIYQRNPSTNQLRAVVKDAEGNIVVRGPVVAENEYRRSAFECTTSEEKWRWMTGVKPVSLADVISELMSVSSEDEDDDEEDDEDDDA